MSDVGHHEEGDDLKLLRLCTYSAVYGQLHNNKHTDELCGVVYVNTKILRECGIHFRYCLSV